jgi:hypothetical protein
MNQYETVIFHTTSGRKLKFKVRKGDDNLKKKKILKKEQNKMDKICVKLDVDVVGKLKGMKKGRESYSEILREVLKIRGKKK